ncbi:hypothetical protein [Diaphorobacter aerolatus]|nr:hypothetical protein [Diaphorobacter aerolatus]
MSAIVLASLAACGDDDNDDEGNPNPPDPALGVVIGGNVSGLGSGKSVVLQNNGGSDLRALQNGKFAFNNVVAQGSQYSVTVSAQPDGQNCKVTNGSGTAQGDVSNVAVECTDTNAPVDPGTGGGETASCMDNPNFRGAGNTWSITTKGRVETNKAMGLVTYRGVSAHQTHAVDTIGLEWDSYTNLIGGKFVQYGSQMLKSAPNESYFSPALEVPISLPLNQTYTQTVDVVTVQPGAAPVAVKTTLTYTYRGRETITTPLGTIETCKLELTGESTLSSLIKWTQWLGASGKYAGFHIRTQSPSETTEPDKIEMSWN